MAQRVAIASLAVAAVFGAGGSSLASTTHHRAISFKGTCQFSGSVSFKPGLSNESQTVRQRVRAPGTCSGTFVDRHGASHDVSDAKSAYVARETAPNSSCASGTAAGRGALVTPAGRLRFLESETRAGALVAATATGVSGGSASGAAAPSSSGDPTVLEKCASDGIKRVPIDIVLTTDGISG